MKNIFALISLIAIIFSFSCNSQNKAGIVNKLENGKKINIDSMTVKAAEKRTQYLQELKDMNNEQLFQQLGKESDRGLEPFNSLAYAEAIERGRKFSENMVKYFRDSTKSSLLSLIALNRIEANQYNMVPTSVRTAILLDALSNSKLYNTFGVPHVRIESAGEIIISEGKNIRNGLVRLLRNTRPAPVWGSEDYAEYMKYSYRICDYALFFIKKIDGDEKFIMPQKQEERDEIISSLLKDR